MMGYEDGGRERTLREMEERVALLTAQWRVAEAMVQQGIAKETADRIAFTGTPEQHYNALYWRGVSQRIANAAKRERRQTASMAADAKQRLSSALDVISLSVREQREGRYKG